MKADDHRLLEQTRVVNKTLSLLVFALQEEAEIPPHGQHEIAAQLETLAETIRARADQQGGSLEVKGVVGSPDILLRVLGPGREPGRDGGP